MCFVKKHAERRRAANRASRMARREGTRPRLASRSPMPGAVGIP
jgi:hypothetical protein